MAAILIGFLVAGCACHLVSAIKKDSMLMMGYLLVAVIAAAALYLGH